MPSILEWTANGFYLVSVFLAARNSIHTWWLGIIGTVLFAILFFQVKLYADVTLMVFFIGTSIYGWLFWRQGQVAAPIRKTPLGQVGLFALLAVVTTLAYGSLLFFTTDAFAPFVDSGILMFSILAQLLLMKRRLETWVFWLLVNTLAVPLYFYRELYLTSIVYLGFWFNAWYGLWSWHQQFKNQDRELQNGDKGFVADNE